MKKLLVIGIAILIAGMAGEANAANLISNGGFEAPDVGGSFVTYHTAPAGFGWTIVNGAPGSYCGIDLINDCWPGVSGAYGDQSVDIDYGTIIYQTIATVPGQSYLFSFAYANNYARPSATGSFGVFDTAVFTGEGDYDFDPGDFLLSGNLTHSGSTKSNMNFLRYESVFTALSDSTTLGFAGETGNQYWGFVVDDVNVDKVIPEPMSVSLLGLGLLGVIARLRRRK